eukprot:CAMPEP_0204492622 /NCGR_PEP_ID=MMETSP0471-20130131/80100_1 /ASSEMBLY_ACC=CAM_ASM_000602 /TAXON_ID=2969 /ORGANISM="Oxyrrhis marina" /LENGTH=67 /DNA_ID=CAMNT_0051496707 /DNA_START=18 /DNA_END=218 /DNA_ORIENTATION=-
MSTQLPPSGAMLREIAHRPSPHPMSMWLWSSRQLGKNQLSNGGPRLARRVGTSSTPGGSITLYAEPV